MLETALTWSWQIPTPKARQLGSSLQYEECYQYVLFSWRLEILKNFWHNWRKKNSEKKGKIPRCVVMHCHEIMKCMISRLHNLKSMIPVSIKVQLVQWQWFCSRNIFSWLPHHFFRFHSYQNYLLERIDFDVCKTS